MRKLIFVALLTAAPVFTLGSTPAEAFGCGWFGFGSATYSYAPAPRTYSYAPARRYYYAPTRRYYGSRVYYGRTLYRPRVARGTATVRLGAEGVGGGKRLRLTRV